jgi:hypothetical protein
VLNALPVVDRLSVEIQRIKRHELVEAEVKRRIVEHEGEILVTPVLESSHQSVPNERGIGEVESECGLGVL